MQTKLTHIDIDIQVMTEWTVQNSLTKWNETFITEFCTSGLFKKEILSILQLSQPYLIAIVDNYKDLIEYKSWNESHPSAQIDVFLTKK